MVSSITPERVTRVFEDAKPFHTVAPSARANQRADFPSLSEETMSDITVTNPGLVNAADEADGLTKINQAITVGPSTNPGPLAQGGDLAPGKGVAQPSPGDVTPAMTAQRTVDGGTASPVSPNTENVTGNTVIGEPSSVQQFFKTINVYP